MSNSTLILEEETIETETPSNVVPMEAPKREAKKWNSTAGPIQFKKVQKVLGDINMEHNCKVEKWGIIGGEEHESCMYSLFGGTVRKEVLDAQCDIGERYNWTITRENYQDIIADCEAVKPALKEGRPVTDKRKTREQDAEQMANFRKIEAERQAKELETKAKVDEKVAGLRVRYPWADQTKRGDVKASANIRALLLQQFPATVFSVRSGRNSSSVDVEWTLGPTEKEVQAVTNMFKDGHYDGMADIHEYDSSVDGKAWAEWMGRATYVSTRRQIPQELKEAVARSLCALQNIEYTGPETRGLCGDVDTFAACDYAYQHIAATHIPLRGKFVRAELYAPQEDPGNVHLFAKLVFEVDLNAPAHTVIDGAAFGSNSMAKWRENTVHQGIEIRFASKPDADTIARMKSNGWRSKREAGGWFWYKKDSETTRAFAKQLCA